MNQVRLSSVDQSEDLLPTEGNVRLVTASQETMFDVGDGTSRYKMEALKEEGSVPDDETLRPTHEKEVDVTESM